MATESQVHTNRDIPESRSTATTSWLSDGRSTGTKWVVPLHTSRHMADTAAALRLARPEWDKTEPHKMPTSRDD